MDQCRDNRFEIIEKAKQDLLYSTDIDSSKDEMKVLDNFLFRCWQMGWLKQYEMEIEEQQDLVWHVLPRECKEKIQKAYKTLVTEYKKYLKCKQINKACSCQIKYNMMEMLFGFDNLYAEVKDWDEVLYVHRSKVQPKKSTAWKNEHSSMLSDADVQFWRGYQCALTDLFGPKCNSDEEVTHEPMPAEPKYHKGDRVFCVVLTYRTECEVDGYDYKTREYILHVVKSGVTIRRRELAIDGYVKPKPHFKYKLGNEVVSFCDKKNYVVTDYCGDDGLNYYIITDSTGYRTSDIEGNLTLTSEVGEAEEEADVEIDEEDVLMCDRNVVRMLYDETDSVKVRQTLECLFGSKCLPDNLIPPHLPVAVKEEHELDDNQQPQDGEEEEASSFG